jgi:GH24 family phage-related lysozyme (muramidase)
LDLSNIQFSSSVIKENVKEVQKLIGLRGREVDGLAGVVTITKLENFLSPILPSMPAGASLIVSLSSLNFIMKEEISSENYYNARLKKPYWPEGESGITIGIGYDLGYNSPTEIEKEWGPLIESTSSLQKLVNVSGYKGEAAKQKLSTVSSISISFEKASIVFYQISMPKYAKQVIDIYPEAYLLPPDAQGALLSLVYNRGKKLSGDSRREMLNIKALVKNKDLSSIPRELRSMKRLWPKYNQRGLVARREKEAIMMEQATYFIRPEEYVFV